MAKKKRKKPMKRKMLKRSDPFANEEFTERLEVEVNKALQKFLTPLDQRVSVLYENMQNIKANVVVATTLLEKKKLLTRDEFFEEFQMYMRTEHIVPDEDGNIPGNSVFSIYNEEK